MQKGNGFLSRLRFGTCFGQEIRVMWKLLTSNSDIHLSSVELHNWNKWLEQNAALTFQTDKILKSCLVLVQNVKIYHLFRTWNQGYVCAFVMWQWHPNETFEEENNFRETIIKRNTKSHMFGHMEKGIK